MKCNIVSNTVINFIIVLILFVSCKKAEDRTCWKSAGEQTERILSLPQFELLEIGSHIRVTLIQDTVHYAIIRGAENLINLVKFDVANNKLTLSNDNKCNFLRNYKKKNIHVFLHFKTLSNIEFDGSETLDSQGELALNTLTFFVKDGAASINLNLDIDYLFASIGKGYSDLNFSGNANYASFKITSNSYTNTNELFIRDSIDFVSNTAVPCKININGAKAQIQTESSGDVIYRGVPISLKENKYGTGLIQPE